MSLSNAFAKTYTLTRDNGETVTTPLLLMDQIDKLIGVLESRRNAALRTAAKEQKLSPEATANFVAIGQREEIEIFHLRNHASNIKGANEILKEVMSPEDLAALSLEERRELARAAVGWFPEKKKDGNVTTDGAANP